MLSLIARRLALFPPTLLATTLLVFLLLNIGPGDATFSRGGQVLSPEARAAFREQAGLDDPLPVRFVHFLGDLAHFRLGDSLLTGAPVGKLLGDAAPVTLQLVALALAFATIVALVVGVVAALFRDRWPDHVARAGAVALIAAPNFWLGMLGINLFAVSLGWLPAGGYVPFGENPVEWFRAMLLPALALGLPVAGILTRIVRTAVVEELDKDYVRTALGAGLPRIEVIGRNVLRNALVSPLTVLGLYFGYLLAGAVLVEIVFALPGLGRMMVDGVLGGDVFVVRSAALVTVTVFLLANLVVDVLYLVLNPRVRAT